MTFQALRHMHASQLIAHGVDVVTISKRLGHAKPSVTLAVYAHMFTSDDRKAAAAVNVRLELLAFSFGERSVAIGWQCSHLF
jgi:integrase